MAETILDSLNRQTNIVSNTMSSIASQLKQSAKIVSEYKNKETEKEADDLTKILDKISAFTDEIGEVKDILEQTQKVTEDIEKQKKEKIKEHKNLSPENLSSDLKKSFDYKKTTKDKVYQVQEKSNNEARKTLDKAPTNKKVTYASKGTFIDPGPRGKDNIPAWLSKGEFVVNSDSSKRYRSLLEQINGGKLESPTQRVRYFSEGGSTDRAGTGGVGGVGGGGPSGPINIPMPDPEEWGRVAGTYFSREADREFKSKISGYATSISAALLGGGGDIFQVLFGGSVKDATEFRKEMRKIAFETQNVDGTMRGLQNTFADIGKSVEETGTAVDQFQDSYMRNLKKGLKDQKEGLKVTKSGLNLATMIGADAAQTADMFGDWNRLLKLSSNQLYQINRDIVNVARMSGVTGDELMKAVKASQDIMKSMANVGTLSADASRNIISVMAEAQKLGVEDPVKKLMDATTSMTKLYMEADSHTQAFLFTMANRLGKMDELNAGSLLKSRGNLKKMSEAMMGQLSDITGGMIDSMDDLDSLSDAQKQHLSLVLKQTYGMDLEEYRKVFQAFEVGGKSLGEKLGELDKQMRNVNSTSEERLLAEKNMREALMNTGFAFMTKFDEQAKFDGVTFAEAATKAVQKFSKEDSEDLAAAAERMGIAYSDTMSAADKWRVAGLITARQLKDAGGKDFTADLEAAMASGDIAKTREILSDMSKEQQKMGIDAKKGVDPMTDMAQTLNEINENIRRMASGVVGKLIDLVGAIGLLIAQAGLIGGMIYGGAGGFLGTIARNMTDALTSLFKGKVGFGGFVKKIAGVFKSEEKGEEGFLSKLTSLFTKQQQNDPCCEPKVATGAVEAMKEAAGGMETPKGPKGSIIPDFKTGDMLKAGANLAKAAAAMAVLIAGAAVLATVILKFGQGLLAVTGLDAKKAIEIAAAVSTVIIGAGAIGAASAGAAYGLKKLKESEDHLKSMGDGAKVLLKMTPQIIGLSLAILGMGAILTYFVSPQKAVEIAVATAAIFAAAGAIASAVMLSATALSNLGNFAKESNQFEVDMGEGIMALLRMTPAILALSAAVLAMGAILTYFVSPQKAIQIATATAMIIAAAASISSSILLAAGGLFLISKLDNYIDDIYEGAAILMALTIPITLLAGAVLAMGYALSLGGLLDMNVAKDIALNTASIIGSAAFISLAILGASAGLAALGALGPYAAFLIPLVFTGAAALLLLTPAMMALSAAILGMGAIFSKMVSPEWAVGVAESVAKIMLSTAAIVGSVLALSALSAGLGALAITAPFVSGLMFVGAAALAVLTPSVLALSAAIMGLGGMFSLINPDTAKSIAETTSQVINSTLSIVWSILKLSALTAVIGALAVFVPVAIPLMYMGAAALLSMSAPIAALSAAMMAIGAGLTTVFNPESAKLVAEGARGVLDAVSAISWSILRMAPMLAALGALGVFAPMVVAAMYVGVGIFALMTPAVVAFAGTVYAMGQAIASIVKPQEVKIISEALMGVSNMSKEIASMVKTLAENVVPLTKAGMFWGDSIATQLTQAMPVFKKLFASIVDFIRFGIMVPVYQNLSNIGVLSKVQESLSHVAGIFKSLEPILEFMSKTVVSFAKKGVWTGTSAVERIEAAMPEFQRMFGAVSKFIAEGIVDPVHEAFKDKKDVLKQVADSLVSIGTIFKSLEPVFKFMNETVVGFTTQGWFGPSITNQLKAKMPEFQEFFSTLVDFIRFGIIVPVYQNLSNIQVLKDVASALSHVAGIFSALEPSFKFMKEVVLKWTTPGWFSKSITKRLQKAMPEFKKFFISFADFIDTGMVSPLKKLIKEIDDLKKAKEVMQFSKELLEDAQPALKSLFSIVTEWTKKTGVFGWGPSLAQQLLSKKEEFKSFFTSVADLIKFGIVSPIYQNLSNVDAVKTAATALGEIEKALSSVASMLGSLKTSIDVAFKDTAWFGNNALVNMDLNKFTNFFKKVTKLVGEGIVTPINETLKDMTALKEAAEKSEIIGKIIDVAMRTMGFMKDYVAGITSDGWWASTADTIIANAGKFKTFFEAVLKFIETGIAAPLNKMDRKVIQEARYQIEDLSDLIEDIPAFLTTLNEQVSSMIDDTAWIGNNSMASNAESVSEEFASYFKNISNFVNTGILIPLSSLPISKEIEESREKILNLTDLIDEIPEFLIKLNEKIGEVLNDTSWMGNNSIATASLDVSGRFKDYFKGIALFVNEGIVMPLEIMPISKNIEDSYQKILAITDIVDELPFFLYNLNDKLNILDSAGLANDKLVLDGQKFAIFFKNLSDSLNQGIIIPLSENFELQKLKEAAEKIKLIAEMMSDLIITMRTLSDISAEFGNAPTINMSVPTIQTPTIEYGKPILQSPEVYSDDNHAALVMNEIKKPTVLEPQTTIGLGPYTTTEPATAAATSTIPATIPTRIEQATAAATSASPATIPTRVEPATAAATAATSTSPAISTSAGTANISNEAIYSGITRYGPDHPFKDLEYSIAVSIRDSLIEMEKARKSGSESDLIDADDKFDNAMTLAIDQNVIRAPKDSEGDEIVFFDHTTQEAIQAAEKYLKKFNKELAPSGTTATSISSPTATVTPTISAVTPKITEPATSVASTTPTTKQDSDSRTLDLIENLRQSGIRRGQWADNGAAGFSTVNVEYVGEPIQPTVQTNNTSKSAYDLSGKDLISALGGVDAISGNTEKEKELLQASGLLNSIKKIKQYEGDAFHQEIEFEKFGIKMQDAVASGLIELPKDPEGDFTGWDSEESILAAEKYLEKLSGLKFYTPGAISTRVEPATAATTAAPATIPTSVEPGTSIAPAMMPTTPATNFESTAERTILGKTETAIEAAESHAKTIALATAKWSSPAAQGLKQHAALSPEEMMSGVRFDPYAKIDSGQGKLTPNLDSNAIKQNNLADIYSIKSEDITSSLKIGDVEKSIAVGMLESLKEIKTAKGDNDLLEAEDKFDTYMELAISRNMMRRPKDSQGEEIMDNTEPEGISAGEVYLSRFLSSQKKYPTSLAAKETPNPTGIDAVQATTSAEFVNQRTAGAAMEQGIETLSGRGSTAGLGTKGPFDLLAESFRDSVIFAANMIINAAGWNRKAGAGDTRVEIKEAAQTKPTLDMSSMAISQQEIEPATAATAAATSTIPATVPTMAEPATAAATSKAATIPTRVEPATAAATSKAATIPTRVEPATAAATSATPATIPTRVEPATAAATSKAATIPTRVEPATAAATSAAPATIPTRVEPATAAATSATPATIPTRVEPATAAATSATPATIPTRVEPATAAATSKAATIPTRVEPATAAATSKAATIPTRVEPVTAAATSTIPATVPTRAEPATAAATSKAATIPTRVEPATAAATSATPATIPTRVEPATAAATSKAATIPTRVEPATAAATSKAATIPTRVEPATAAATSATPATIPARVEPAIAAATSEMEKDPKFQRDMKIIGKGRATERYNIRKSLERNKASEPATAAATSATPATIPTRVEPATAAATSATPATIPTRVEPATAAATSATPATIPARVEPATAAATSATPATIPARVEPAIAAATSKAATIPTRVEPATAAATATVGDPRITGGLESRLTPEHGGAVKDAYGIYQTGFGDSRGLEEMWATSDPDRYRRSKDFVAEEERYDAAARASDSAATAASASKVKQMSIDDMSLLDKATWYKNQEETTIGFALNRARDRRDLFTNEDGTVPPQGHPCADPSITNEKQRDACLKKTKREGEEYFKKIEREIRPRQKKLEEFGKNWSKYAKEENKEKFNENLHAIIDHYKGIHSLEKYIESENAKERGLADGSIGIRQKQQINQDSNLISQLQREGAPPEEIKAAQAAQTAASNSNLFVKPDGTRDIPSNLRVASPSLSAELRALGNAKGGVGIASKPAAYIAGEAGPERISIEKLNPSGLTDLEEKTSAKLESSINKIGYAVGHHAVPTIRPVSESESGSQEEGATGVAGVQPVHLRDITESILRDKASAESGTNRMQSDELARMEEVANKQVDELEQIREGIMTLVSLLRPTGTPVGTPSQLETSTKDPRRPMHALTFGKMKYGRIGGNANRNLVNNGEN